MFTSPRTSSQNITGTKWFHPAVTLRIRQNYHRIMFICYNCVENIQWVGSFTPSVSTDDMLTEYIRDSVNGGFIWTGPDVTVNQHCSGGSDSVWVQFEWRVFDEEINLVFRNSSSDSGQSFSCFYKENRCKIFGFLTLCEFVLLTQQCSDCFYVSQLKLRIRQYLHQLWRFWVVSGGRTGRAG